MNFDRFVFRGAKSILHFICICIYFMQNSVWYLKEYLIANTNFKCKIYWFFRLYGHIFARIFIAVNLHTQISLKFCWKRREPICCLIFQQILLSFWFPFYRDHKFLFFAAAAIFHCLLTHSITAPHFLAHSCQSSAAAEAAKKLGITGERGCTKQNINNANNRFMLSTRHHPRFHTLS